jgi:hypothetical protein
MVARGDLGAELPFPHQGWMVHRQGKFRWSYRSSEVTGISRDTAMLFSLG